MENEEFPEQRENEELILVGRKHWYLLVFPIIKVFLGLVLVFIVLRYLGASIYFTIAFFLWVGIGLTYFIYTYVIWAKSKYLVTSHRVIMIEQRSLFGKKVTEIDLKNIHTATYEIKGPANAAFNFGDVVLQSYGSPKAMVLKNVAKSQNIQKRISELISEKTEKEEKFEEEISKKNGPKKYIPRAPKIESEE